MEDNLQELDNYIAQRISTRCNKGGNTRANFRSNRDLVVIYSDFELITHLQTWK